MRRLQAVLALLLVLTTGSALTLACAFFCDSARAASFVKPDHASHCHAPAASNASADGEGFRPRPVSCPVMESLSQADASALPSAVKAPPAVLNLLPFETSLLAQVDAASFDAAVRPQASPPIPEPPFLRNLVLRL